MIVIIFINFKEEYAIGYNPEKKEDNGQGIPVRRIRNRGPRLSFGNHGMPKQRQAVLDEVLLQTGLDSNLEDWIAE
jgi:hypothetical protein